MARLPREFTPGPTTLQQTGLSPSLVSVSDNLVLFTIDDFVLAGKKKDWKRGEEKGKSSRKGKSWGRTARKFQYCERRTEKLWYQSGFFFYSSETRFCYFSLIVYSFYFKRRGSLRARRCWNWAAIRRISTAGSTILCTVRSWLAHWNVLNSKVSLLFRGLLLYLVILC